MYAKTVIVCAICAFLASCASVKKEPLVPSRIAHPYEFFDFDRDLYCTLPVSGNEALLNAFVKTIAPKMTDFALSNLTAKTDALYVACDITADSAIGANGEEPQNEPIEFQFVATGAFPVSYRSMLFTKKNGFREVVEKQETTVNGEKSRTFNYFYNDQAGFYIDIPSENYCFADTDFLSGMIFAKEQTERGTVFTPDWDDVVKNHLFSYKTSSSIDWYLSSPNAIVTMLFGPSMRLPLSYAFGSLTPIGNANGESGVIATQKPLSVTTELATESVNNASGGAREKSAKGVQSNLLYTATITVKVSDKRFIKPNIALIKMLTEKYRSENGSAGLTVTQEGDEFIRISGLVIDMQNVLTSLTKKAK